LRIGKTSTILALARQVFGCVYLFSGIYKRPELFKSRVLELNASDERGISVVREKVKAFARVTVAASTAYHPYPWVIYRRNVPPYKLIILDEADSMTTDAQVRHSVQGCDGRRRCVVPWKPTLKSPAFV
jgi:replication factor C subunit 2/4